MNQTALGNAALPHLNELSSAWQHESRHAFNKAVMESLEALPNIEAKDFSQSALESLETQVSQHAIQWLKEDRVPACLEWLGTDPLGVSSNVRLNETDKAYIVNQVNLSLENLPEIQLFAPQSHAHISPSRWALTASLGAFLGMLLLAPISNILFGQRLFGLFTGGLLGSATLVLIFSSIASHPALLGNNGEPKKSGLMALFRPLASIRSSLTQFLLSPKLAWVNASFKSTFEPQIKSVLTQRLQYVLASCWFEIHQTQTRAKQAQKQDESRSEPLPGAVYQALADLYLDFKQTNQSQSEHFLDAIDVLFQRFEDSRYQWVFVDAGTLLTREVQAQFDTLGVIPENTPVKTRRPALVIDGKVIFKGELRKMR